MTWVDAELGVGYTHTNQSIIRAEIPLPESSNELVVFYFTKPRNHAQEILFTPAVASMPSVWMEEKVHYDYSR